MTGKHLIRVLEAGRVIYSRRASYFTASKPDEIIGYIKESGLIEKESHYFDGGTYHHDYIAKGPKAPRVLGF